MIIFLYGEDTFRSRQKLKELKDKFLREVDASGNSLTTIEAENVNMSRISEVSGSASLFSKKRMIVIENIFSNKNKEVFDQLIAYFSKNEDDENIVIFWDENGGGKIGKNKLFKFLSKQKFVQEFNSLNNLQLAAWIKEEVGKQDAKISQQAIMLLAGYFGSDLWQLSNELKKIIEYKKGKDLKLIQSGQFVTIEKEDVEELCRGQVDENIFALTDAISARNKSLAINLFQREIESGVAPAYLLHMVVRQFKIMIQVREGLDQGYTSKKIISQLKLHPFVVQKSTGQVRNFTLDKLKNIFNRLVEIDQEIKIGKNDLESALTLLIARI